MDKRTNKELITANDLIQSIEKLEQEINVTHALYAEWQFKLKLCPITGQELWKYFK